MANIEQTGLLSRPMMTLRMRKIGILQRHIEAGKRDHFGSMFEMQIIQLRATE
jgi:hypothetical protein